MQTNPNPNNRIRIRGGADRNGIWYQFYQDYGNLKINNQICKVSQDSIGQIKCQKGHRSEMKVQIEPDIEKYSNNVLFVLPSISMICVFLAILFSHNVQIMNFFLMIAVWAIACMCIHKAIGIFIARLLKDEDVKAFSSFLGAHNAVENAYKKFLRIPTLEEVKCFSCYAENTEYLKNVDKAIFVFFLSFIPLVSDKEYIIIWVIISLLITIFFKNLNILRKIQVLIVEEPTDIQLEMAIMALEEAEKEIMHLQLFITAERGPFFVACQKNCSNCQVADICPQNHDRLSC